MAEPAKKEAEPGKLDKFIASLKEGIKEGWDDLHIGNGHASAMARLGLSELRQAVSFGPGSVEQSTPYGIFGTKTPGEVAQDRDNNSLDAEQEKSVEVTQGSDHGLDAQQEPKSVLGFSPREIAQTKEQQGREQQNREQSRGRD